MMKPKSKQFLNEYLESLSGLGISEKDLCRKVDSFHFCADKQSANTCSELVRKGIKTATCSMKYWYEHDNEPMPVVGQLCVITDWDENPTAIIKIVSVTESRFCDIGESFAFAEGEGDKTLEYWRKVHWDFFSKECNTIGIKAYDEMMLVLEHFKVVFIRP